MSALPALPRRRLRWLWAELVHRPHAWELVRQPDPWSGAEYDGPWQVFCKDASLVWGIQPTVFLCLGSDVLAYSSKEGKVCPILFHRRWMSLYAHRSLARFPWVLWHFRLKREIGAVTSFRGLRGDRQKESE